ncbi:Rieske (2Fe-2S) protein [uncultured Friedmanniella sp.]|uniref:Rieske (2Fe-2S) protein n=1 Tax=uncultured Friedmanniella sp. TaxID=335381 RepID=UPI0035CC62DC
MNSYLRPATSVLSRRNVLARAGLAAAALGTLAACGGNSSSSGGSSGSGSAAGVSAATSEIPVGGGKIFADAKTVVTQPTAGQYKAFSSICTHAGCPVAEVTTTINCNCHGSKFALADGAVVDGPASKPLEAKTATVSGSTVTVPA